METALDFVDLHLASPAKQGYILAVNPEKVIAAGCEATGAMEAMIAGGMSEDDAEDACLEVRTDGRSVDIDGDYTETLASIDANTNAIGVFGLAFYENNTDKLKVATMSGVAP